MNQSISGLFRSRFQKTLGSKQTDLFFLHNSNNTEVAITNYGGAIMAIMVPDRDGNLDNVIQGHDCIDDCINSSEPFLSTLVGRYANRIKNGKFTLEGTDYQLAINNGPNHLHGGPTGFHARVWDADQISPQKLKLQYVSPHNEEGFPGTLTVEATYTWTDDNELIIEYKATTDRTTIVNLTSHGFFALQGIHSTQNALSQVLEINAGIYLPIDETSIPTAHPQLVKNTPFDFTKPKPILQDINADHEQIRNGAGFDHCFVLNKATDNELAVAARLYDPISGRAMELRTTEPGLQFYSDNWASNIKGPDGILFQKHSALCFEAQHFPDSPNRPEFPSVILHPDETYTQTTIYKFLTI